MRNDTGRHRKTSVFGKTPVSDSRISLGTPVLSTIVIRCVHEDPTGPDRTHADLCAHRGGWQPVCGGAPDGRDPAHGKPAAAGAGTLAGAAVAAALDPCHETDRRGPALLCPCQRAAGQL